MGGFSFNLDLSGIIFGMVSLAISAVGTIGLIVPTVIYFHHRRHRPARIAVPRLWLRASLLTMGLGGLGVLITFWLQDRSGLRPTREWFDQIGAVLWIVIFIGLVAVSVIRHDHLRRHR